MTPKLIPGKAFKGFLAIAVVLSSTLFVPGAFSALAGRFHEGDETALNGREQIWTYSIHTLSDAGLLPMLIGTGYNSAAVILPPAMEPGSWNYHNEYLNNLMDAGLIGLGTFVLLSGVMWRLITKTDPPAEKCDAWVAGVPCRCRIFWSDLWVSSFCLLLGAACGGMAAQQVPSSMNSLSPLDLFEDDKPIPGSLRQRPQSHTPSHRALCAFRNWRNAIHKSVQEDLLKIAR